MSFGIELSAATKRLLRDKYVLKLAISLSYCYWLAELSKTHKTVYFLLNLK